jgi:hypothetical protein
MRAVSWPILILRQHLIPTEDRLGRDADGQPIQNGITYDPV